MDLCYKNVYKNESEYSLFRFPTQKSFVTTKTSNKVSLRIGMKCTLDIFSVSPLKNKWVTRYLTLFVNLNCGVVSYKNKTFYT